MPTAPRRKYAPRLPPEERREQLLDAALELVAEEGLPAVSMLAVARHADVTRPVVYSVFTDLDELLSALVEREEQRAFAQVAAAMPSMPDASSPPQMTPDEIGVEAIGSFLRAVAENPHTWRLILLPVEGTPRALRERVEQTRGMLLEQIELLVAWGIEQRGGPKGVEVELLSRTMLVLAEEAGRLVLTRPDDFTPARITTFARALISKVARD